MLIVESQGRVRGVVRSVSTREVVFVRAVESVSSAAGLHGAESPAPKFSCIVGLCRPQTVKKVLEFCASVGFHEVHFVLTERSQRSYMTSKVFEPEQMREQLILGVEQGGVPSLPIVQVWSHLKILFAEKFPRREFHSGSAQDQVHAIGVRSGSRILADTHTSVRSASSAGPGRESGPIAVSTVEMNWLAVGPESGWSDAERTQFLEREFDSVSLGPYILRVEHALAMLRGACDAGGLIQLTREP